MGIFKLQTNNFCIPENYHIPPTIYAVLNSIVNFDNTNPKSIKELAKYGREEIFDFDYPLSEKVSKEDFECMILKHFMMRRIGYETVTAFKIALDVKLNEIMPNYNRLFNALDLWEIFEDGEVTTRTQSDSRDVTTSSQTSDTSTNTLNNTTSANNTSDRRYSDTPQNQITDVQSGSYVSEYHYDTDLQNATAQTSGSATNNGTSNQTSNDYGTLNETIKRTPADKMSNYVEFTKEKQNIYTMIFKDLDSLFYQII